MIPDPAPPSNTEKVTGRLGFWLQFNIGAQASYLKTLSEECDAPDA